MATERIIEVVKNFEKVDASKVTPTASFKEDLDLDSLDGVEVVMAIEEVNHTTPHHTTPRTESYTDTLLSACGVMFSRSHRFSLSILSDFPHFSFVSDPR